MKIIAINGSPNAKGNTASALKIVGLELQKQGIELEVLHIGNQVIRGCMGCNKCRDLKNERCIIEDDVVNESVQKMKRADGMILACPVYFSGVPGTMKSFLDRSFCVANFSGGLFRHKVGAAVVVVRRTGGSSTLDCLNHFITYGEMIVATSNYWNVAHGRVPGDMPQDVEAVQIMEVLARQIAWLCKMKAESKQIPPEKIDKKVWYHFVH